VWLASPSGFGKQKRRSNKARNSKEAETKKMEKIMVPIYDSSTHGQTEGNQPPKNQISAETRCTITVNLDLARFPRRTHRNGRPSPEKNLKGRTYQVDQPTK
jgi:hypothetical protein